MGLLLQFWGANTDSGLWFLDFLFLGTLTSLLTTASRLTENLPPHKEGVHNEMPRMRVFNVLASPLPPSEASVSPSWPKTWAPSSRPPWLAHRVSLSGNYCPLRDSVDKAAVMLTSCPPVCSGEGSAPRST